MDPIEHDLMDDPAEERTEGQPIHQWEGDDSLLSVLEAIDSDELAEALDHDEKFAQELQLQEVLMSYTKSTRPYNDTGDALVPLLCLCELCESTMPSQEAFRATTCSHALCRACSRQYIEAEVHKDAAFVKCPHAGCDAVLEPETYRGFIRPEVFNRWIDAHQRGHQKKSIVLMDQHQRKDPIFHVSIEGQFDRCDLLELSNTLLDALAKQGDGLGDPMGKKSIQFPHSIAEFGQCSTAPLIVVEFYCSICMESKPFQEIFDINGCSHKFCKDCVSLYVAAKVGENLIAIGCPDPECKDGNLEPETCRSILPVEVFDRWGDALCESALGEAKLYCPFKDCSALLLNEGGGDGGEPPMTEAECPHCRRVLCAQCKVPWHVGVDCRQYQLLDEDERGREDLMLRELVNRNRWQRCPKCKIYVEKIDGCTFMSCRCGYCFCYVCASPLSKDNHFCNNCEGGTQRP